MFRFCHYFMDMFSIIFIKSCSNCYQLNLSANENFEGDTKTTICTDFLQRNVESTEFSKSLSLWLTVTVTFITINKWETMLNSAKQGFWGRTSTTIPIQRSFSLFDQTSDSILLCSKKKWKITLFIVYR